MHVLHVSRLITNVKTIRALDLAPCTLLVGDNALGKSGVVAALELALTGRCQEAGATPSSLMELAAGSEGLSVEAILSDGSEVSFRVEGSTAKAKTPIWIRSGKAAPFAPGVMIGALLQSEVQDLLSKEPKRQREALLAICCPEVSAQSIQARLPEAFRREWDAAWSQRREGADADCLIATAELIRANLRAARSQAKAAGEGQRPKAHGIEALEALRRDVAAAQEARRLWDARSRAELDLPAMRDRLETLRHEAQESIGRDPTVIRRAVTLVEAAHHLAALLSEEKVGRCTACGQHVIDRSWTERRALLGEKLADLRRGMAKNLTRPGAAEIERLAAQIDEARLLVEAPEYDALRSPQEALAALESRLRDAEAARARLSVWEQSRTVAAQAMARADVLMALSGVADRIVADVLEGAVSTFCSRASEALGMEGKVAVQLFDGSRSVCRVGIDRDGSLRSWRVLSGAERTNLVAALASAWGTTRREAVKIVIVDEVALGRERLEGLCAALRGAVASGAISQALICSITDWGLAPEGWRVVKLEDLE